MAFKSQLRQELSHGLPAAQTELSLEVGWIPEPDPSSLSGQAESQLRSRDVGPAAIFFLLFLLYFLLRALPCLRLLSCCCCCLCFQLNNLRLSNQLVNTIDNPQLFPPLSEFPKSQTVAYQYYYGRLQIMEEKFDLVSHDFFFLLSLSFSPSSSSPSSCLCAVLRSAEWKQGKVMKRVNEHEGRRSYLAGTKKVCHRRDAKNVWEWRVAWAKIKMRCHLSFISSDCRSSRRNRS